MKITCTALLVLQTLQCLASDDSQFRLTSKATGNCLIKSHDYCNDLRWTSGNRLLAIWIRKCLGVQGKSVGSEISLYDCDETSELQKWECRNETLLALKDQELYVELKADNTAVLSKTIGTNSHFVISGTSSGACTRTYRELYTIEGNAHGRPCMFPFFYKDWWYEDCTSTDVTDRRNWCAVETKYDNQLWGYCPTNTREHWSKHITTGAYYQLNTQAAVTWSQAETSCKQQGATLLSITDPHEQAYVTALLQTAGRGQGDKLWIGLVLDLEHGWQWSGGNPYRYLNWDSGHPVPDPGHSCGVAAGAVQFSWQSSKCTKKLGYICHSKGTVAPPTEPVGTGFCTAPWIPYNGHCFFLKQTQKTWADAQRECRKEGGDLVSIHNVEEQSFVISQLGYASTDELWIGLNDRKTEGLFDWSDHSTVSFTSWEFGKPALSTEQEDCVLIRGENGNWADRVCDEKHGFICMKTSASEPSGHELEQNVGCKTGWIKHGSYCYFVGTETKTFDEAKDDCKSSGSYLADVSNGVDNAYLVSLVGLRPEKYFWLGLSNQKNIDFFVWTNTDTVRFTHWNAAMPGHHQGCVAMTTGILGGLWDVLPCTNKEKYICKHLAEGAALTPAPPTLPSPKCAEGWYQLLSRNKCYKLFSEPSVNKKTWYEARDYCRAIGGDLLSIHSAAELLIQNRYARAWIGLSAPDPVTGYVWSDKSPVNFQHWEVGEPNNKNNVESCAEFKLYKQNWSGSWNDVHCEKYNAWLCQIYAGVIPKPPPLPIAPDYNVTTEGWLEWKGNQYFINRKSVAMEEARDFCKKRQSDLVTINSEAEAVFLWKQISKMYESVWIGLTVDLDATFSWMDGSPVLFQRWAEGQPDFKNFDENCAFMEYSTGFWHDNNCGYEHPFICKRSGPPPANTTVAPTEATKGGCPLHWKKFNSKCYSIINDQKYTWYEARKQCQAMGGNLVSIPSRHVEVFLMTQMADAPTTDLWIGFRSLDYEELYWTDGQPRKYVNMGFQDSYYMRKYFFDRSDPDMFRILRHIQIRFLNHQRKRCVVINTNPSFAIGKWLPKSCNDTNGFICHRNVDPSFLDSPEWTVPLDYVKILNSSIKVITQQMNWDAARKHCQDDGATLASLRNEWTHFYVELLALNLKVPLWIGLNKAQTHGYFRYIDGWHMRFSHWGKKEPSVDRPCVYVDVDGKWKTTACNQTMNSVCTKSTDLPPTEPSDFPGVCPVDPNSLTTGQIFFWLPFKGYCYIFFTEVKVWADASASCVRHGGTLASIEDPSEQDFIERNAKIFQDSQTSFWIGLFKTHKGEWLWLDRTVMDYTNWADGQPADHIHGEISTVNGTWRTAHEHYRRSYICKTPKVLLPTPSPSSRVVTDHRLPGHAALTVVLVITGVAILAVTAFVLIKRPAHLLPIQDNLRTFENPLFFSYGQSKPDTRKLIENAEPENPEPLTAM